MDGMNLYEPLNAMAIILLVSFALSLITNVVNKFLVYTPDFIRKKKVVDEMKKEYMKLSKVSKDEKQLKKLEKKLEAIKKMEAELSIKSLRSFVTIVIYFVAWFWLDNAYRQMKPFILLPIQLPFIGSALNYSWLYILSVIWFNLLLRRILIPEL